MAECGVLGVLPFGVFLYLRLVSRSGGVLDNTSVALGTDRMVYETRVESFHCQRFLNDGFTSGVLAWIPFNCSVPFTVLGYRKPN